MSVHPLDNRHHSVSADSTDEIELNDAMESVDAVEVVEVDDISCTTRGRSSARRGSGRVGRAAARNAEMGSASSSLELSSESVFESEELLDAEDDEDDDEEEEDGADEVRRSKTPRPRRIWMICAWSGVTASMFTALGSCAASAALAAASWGRKACTRFNTA